MVQYVGSELPSQSICEICDAHSIRREFVIEQSVGGATKSDIALCAIEIDGIRAKASLNVQINITFDYGLPSILLLQGLHLLLSYK